MDTTPEPSDTGEHDELEHVDDAQDVLLAREALADPAPSVPLSDVKARLGL